ncbi:hypothetical protein DCC39_06800 [Pueribacillus theae]|uniref:Sporulation protein YtxC n=1 Tax=Pueribacillus theae TaxID=2171751 RepID=A0A2U1K460_9BACI|nr:hypothetical protein DCC39_06800 [Pueribacillus theae]
MKKSLIFLLLQPYICTRYVAEGGALLIKVEFSNEHDCEAIYKCITEHIEKGNYETVFGISARKIGMHQLFVSFDKDEVTFKYALQPMLARVFRRYILSQYEMKWFHQLLENKFYFRDYDEKNAIASIFFLIVDGKRTELPNVKKLPSREKLIEESIQSLLMEGFQKELAFSFDSFIKFRLKEYQECLLAYAELAIDEYKLEQDYQNFVANLRLFLERKKPIIDKLHVVYGSKPIFYDDDFRLIQEEKITSFIKKSGFFPGNIPVESTLLQPLLMLAPNQIFLYIDNERSGLLYTLENIFQERITFCKLTDLPNQSSSF